MSTSFFDALATELRDFLAPVVDAVEDPYWLAALLNALGSAPDNPAAAPFVSTLQAIVGVVHDIEAIASNPSPSFADIGRLLEASRNASNAIQSLELSGQITAGLGAIGKDLSDLLIGVYIAGRFPLFYRIAVLLCFIDAPEDVIPTQPVVVGGKTIRQPVSLPRFHPDRLVALFQDPVALLKAKYLNPLATDADANAMADKLFPRVRGLLTVLGVLCRYGVTPEERPLLGDGAPFVDHALTVWLAEKLRGADAEAGLTFALSPAARGDLGLVITPFGSLKFTDEIGAWTMEVDVTADVEALAIGRRGTFVAASAQTTSIDGKLSATLAPPDEGEGPALILGSPTGTRLEVGGAKFLTELAVKEGTFGCSMSADVSSSQLVLSPGDGDGFLRSILPAEGLQAKFDLGLAWSDERGLTLRGSAGLDATLPVGISVGSVLTVPTLHLRLHAGDSGLQAEVSASVGVSIGPVDIVVDRVGIATTVTFPEAGGNLGPVDLDVGFKPPTRLGLSIDAGPVVGGGFLAVGPERGEYAGELQLQFEGIAVRAIGLLTTHLPGGKPGYSLLVIVFAEFPPLQLGLGFMLVGVGGLLGINRTVAVEALRAGLKTGALGAVLSPPDPKANVGQLVATLAGLFPPAAGRHVFAPTARIVWGSPTLITIELALVLELPAPVRLVVLGRLRALLPDEHEAIVRIQVDVLGVINFDRSEAAVDATLVDSRLAQFALTGDMALRMSWGAQPSFLLAVGGFHPRFAAPPGFPALERVAVPLAGGNNPKLRLEAYLALTSNTVQFGARVDLAAKAGSFSIAGFLSFDALVTLAPLAFIVDIAAKLAVKAGGHTLLSVSLALTLSGPRPWRARGRASFSILFFDISFGFDVTIGDDTPPILPAPVDVTPLLLAAFADARSWSAQLPAGAAALVTLRALEPGTAVLAHPLATLQVRQRVAPLERTLDRFGTSVPSGARRFRITLATIGGVRTTVTPLQDRFAPAQFTALSDDAKLSAPSFEEMTSGAALGADGYATGAAVIISVVYEQLLVTAPGVPEPKSQRGMAIPGDIFVALTATPPARPPAFAVRDAA